MRLIGKYVFHQIESFLSILQCSEIVRSIFRLSLKVRALPPKLSWFSSQKICKEEEEVRKRAGDIMAGGSERKGGTDRVPASGSVKDVSQK